MEISWDIISTRHVIPRPALPYPYGEEMQRSHTKSVECCWLLNRGPESRFNPPKPLIVWWNLFGLGQDRNALFLHTNPKFQGFNSVKSKFAIWRFPKMVVIPHIYIYLHGQNGHFSIIHPPYCWFSMDFPWCSIVFSWFFIVCFMVFHSCSWFFMGLVFAWLCWYLQRNTFGPCFSNVESLAPCFGQGAQPCGSAGPGRAQKPRAALPAMLFQRPGVSRAKSSNGFINGLDYDCLSKFILMVLLNIIFFWWLMDYQLGWENININDGRIYLGILTGAERRERMGMGVAGMTINSD